MCLVSVNVPVWHQKIFVSVWRVRGVSGGSLDSIRKVSGKNKEGVWKGKVGLYGHGRYLLVFGVCVVFVWSVSGGCVE